jgi:transcriptional regulator with XRE-family HTH domain
MKTIHDPRYCEFIDLLTAARLGRQITQQELAASLGRQQSYVAKVENLDRRIDVVETRDWLVALGLEPSDFMTRVLWWRVV